MEYKRIIMEMINKEVREEDVVFLRQLYTIIKRHIEKKKSL